MRSNKITTTNIQTMNFYLYFLSTVFAIYERLLLSVQALSKSTKKKIQQIGMSYMHTIQMLQKHNFQIIMIKTKNKFKNKKKKKYQSIANGTAVWSVRVCFSINKNKLYKIKINNAFYSFSLSFAISINVSCCLLLWFASIANRAS